MRDIENSNAEHFENKVRKRAIEGSLALDFSDFFQRNVPVFCTPGKAAKVHEKNWGIVTGKTQRLRLIEWNKNVIPEINKNLGTKHRHTKVIKGCIYQTTTKILGRGRFIQDAFIDADLTCILRTWERLHWQDFCNMIDICGNRGIRLGLTLTSSLRISGRSKGSLGKENLRIIRKIEQKMRQLYRVKKIMQRIYKDHSHMLTQAWTLVPRSR